MIGWHLREEPAEVHNRYGDPAYKEVITKLKNQLKQLREDLNETDEDYPHLQKIIGALWND